MVGHPRKHGVFTAIVGDQVWEFDWNQEEIQVRRRAVYCDPAQPDRAPRLRWLRRGMDLDAERPVCTEQALEVFAPWVPPFVHEYFPRWATPLDIARRAAGLPIIVGPGW